MPGKRHAAIAGLILGVAFACASACTAQKQHQEQYPPPLLHTPAHHPAQHVILISIDGLHAFDLARWVAAHPHSSLAELSRRGVTYTNAHLPWDDPAVGMLALATGGTPLSTGIFASHFYDRALSPPGSHCRTSGAAVDLPALPDNILTHPDQAAASLPLDPANGCSPVTPHGMVHDGNIFELVHAQGGRTAWAGDRPGLVDLYRGPSGLGLDEAISISPDGESIAAASAADDRRLALMLHWIKGEDSTARDRPGVPELFGMNFTAFAAAQRAPSAGYADMLGDPSEALTAQLRYIDTSVGHIVEDLRAEHLFDSTWIIVTATYTQSPGATRAPRSIPVESLRAILGKTPSSGAAYVSSEGAVTIWLQHPEMADRVAHAYAAKSATLGIGEIYTSERLKLSLEPERSTSRSPDLVLFPAPGILWKSSARSGTTAQAGFRDEDKHVALLVSGAQLTGRTDPTSVPTSQTAAMLLRALGMEKLDLPALHREHSPALPGIF